MSEVKTKSKKIKISAPYSKEDLPHVDKCIVFKYVQFTEFKFI